MGYDLNKAVDQNIQGKRTKIDADDAKKVKIVETFAKLKGESFKVDEIEYLVNTFEQVDGKIAIIHLVSDDTNIYFRPSGTGPGVRIYIFGPSETIKHNLKQIKKKINSLF